MLLLCALAGSPARAQAPTGFDGYGYAEFFNLYWDEVQGAEIYYIYSCSEESEDLEDYSYYDDTGFLDYSGTSYTPLYFIITTIADSEYWEDYAGPRGPYGAGGAHPIHEAWLVYGTNAPWFPLSLAEDANYRLTNVDNGKDVAANVDVAVATGTAMYFDGSGDWQPDTEGSLAGWQIAYGWTLPGTIDYDWDGAIMSVEELGNFYYAAVNAYTGIKGEPAGYNTKNIVVNWLQFDGGIRDGTYQGSAQRKFVFLAGDLGDIGGSYAHELGHRVDLGHEFYDHTRVMYYAYYLYANPNFGVADRNVLSPDEAAAYENY
jgi:hypothetical protein